MNVAILGGGIAGLATAIALTQNGIDACVYERRSSVHGLGAGVVCWPNACFVLSELGLLEELRSASWPITGMRRTASDGTDLGRLDVQSLDKAMGFPSLATLRRDLMSLLLRRAETCGVPIWYSCPATAIQRTGSRCQVKFADGASISPDLIIGADGRMNSIARQFVTGDNRPVFQRFVNWIGTFTPATRQPDAAEIRDYWGVGARFGIVPVAPQLSYWAGGVAVDEDVSDDGTQRIAQLQAAFCDWPDPVREIVAQASANNTKLVTLYDHDPAPVWQKENVLMIGDAAHAALPTSGQGAAQALEDAWQLSQELSQSPLDVEIALQRFTHSRQRKTAGIILGGRALAAALFSTDPEQCAARNRQAQNTDYAALAAGMASGWSAGLPLGR